MADWSIWKALEEWRNRRHELDPLFARAGVAPEIESAVNLVCVNLRRQTPTPPLVTGDKYRDEEEFGRFYQGYFRHFDDGFQRAETLLRLPWVPEAAPIAEQIHSEIAMLRQRLQENPGRNPGCGRLEVLLQQYASLNFSDLPQLADVLAQRKRELIDIAGYPLLVQHASADPAGNAMAPVSSAAFQQALAEKLNQYLNTPWLHNRVLSHAYMQMSMDSACSRSKSDVQDDTRLQSAVGHRWPTLSILLPGREHVDQLWYLLLAIFAITAVFLEMWWVAMPLIVWLNFSIGAHRRERQQIDAYRAELLRRYQGLKRLRDRFSAGQLSLESLVFQLRQSAEWQEYFDELVYELPLLHQHEA